MFGTEELFTRSGWLASGAVVLAAYGIGCFSTGYYLVRFRTGQDLRTLGSGSCGARNASRALGSMVFAFPLAGFLANGGLAVWIAQMVTGRDRVVLFALIAVVAGHVWPAQLGFRGGKGIATSLAGLLLYDPWLTGVYLLVYGAGFSLTRKAVASSLAAYALLPLVSYLSKQDVSHVSGAAILACFILVAHHQNILSGARTLTARRTPAQTEL
jgi:glycerol-3-phosphate acyltransferase PlsY